jgi:cytochrome c
VPGTTMTYAGVPDPKERADLIAYLSKQKCK